MGYYEAALKGFQQAKDSLGIGYVYLNYAQLYQAEKNYKEAEKYFWQVYDIRLHAEKKVNISSLLQLGLFYRKAGDSQKSTTRFREADSLCRQRKDNISLTEVDMLLAENFLQQQDLGKAEQIAKQGFQFLKSKNLQRHLPKYYLLFGKIAFEKNQLTLATQYFNQVIESAKPFKDLEPKMEAHYFLGRIYYQKGEREKGLQNQNEYLALRDSLKEKELAIQVERLKFQFALEIEQKQRENDLLKALEVQNEAVIKKQRVLNFYYASALAVIVIVALLLFRNIRLKQKHNEELNHKQNLIVQQSEELKAKNLVIEKTNSNLEALVEQRTKTVLEKNKLLTEYAYFNSHKVRGPLARILGLLVVMDLEQQINNARYIDMLRNAGNELDEVIRQINEQISQSDEDKDS